MVYWDGEDLEATWHLTDILVALKVIIDDEIDMDMIIEESMKRVRRNNA